LNPILSAQYRRLPTLAALVLTLPLSLASAAPHRITGGTVQMIITEGAANSIYTFNAYFDETRTRAQVLTDPAPGNAPFTRDADGVTLIDSIRPHGVTPADQSGPGSGRNGQVTTLEFEPSDVLGTWSLSDDLFGFTGGAELGEQIALTGMQRFSGPFTGVLLYGDFALRRSSDTRLALTSNIDFLSAEWAEIGNPVISVQGNTLTIRGDLLIDQALLLLDSSAVVGKDFGDFILTATIEEIPSEIPQPVIEALTLAGPTATLSASHGPAGGSFSVLTSNSLLLPMVSWEVQDTGTFAPDGKATNLFAVTEAERSRFYRLRMP